MLSVLIPCYNESTNLPVLVERLEAVLNEELDVEFELVLVDDGSTDDTWEVAERLADEKPWIVPVRHETNRGMSEGWATALAASKGEHVLTMDADLQYRPEDIPLLWRRMLDEKADIVQGWRLSSPGGSRVRRGLSRLFSLVLQLLFGTNLNDVKSGFILYKRKVMEEIMEDRHHFKFFQHFPTIAAHERGYDVVEVGVVFDRRHSGESFIGNVWSFGLASLGDFPKAVKLYRRRRR